MFEKKRGKRFLASVMALIMLLSLAPVGTLAAENEDQQENTAVTLPANEANPKPVVTDEEDTTNTNEESTPLPSNEDYAETHADNNDASTAVSEMPVIMNPVDLLNQASDYTTELTWKPSSSIKEATFFYLKTPTSNLNSNKAEDWGPALGTGKVETSALRWTTNVDGLYGWNVENSFDVTNSMISAWPATHGTYVAEKDGYVLTRDGDHWNSIFEAYKDSVEKTLGITDLQKSDITDIILKPFKVSRFNKTDESYHVDCKVEVKCTQVVTVTFNVKDVNDDDYVQVKAENYKSGSQVNFPSYSPEKAGYKFSGWYFDRNLSEKVEDNYTIGNENVDFYAKYTPKTYTVTFNAGENGKLDRNQDTVTKTGENGTSLSAPTPKANEGFEFAGWVEGNDTNAETVEIPTTITKNVTYTATWREKTYTVTFNAGDNGKLDQDKSTVTKTGKSGTSLSVPATNANEGYEFAGWVKDNTPVNAIPNTITENATYTATWKLAEVSPTTAKYTVKHHKWDVAQNKYIEDTSKAQSYDGTIGTEVNVTDKATSYEGYVLNKQVSELKGKVTADNQLILNLYYDIDKIGSGDNKDQPDGIPDRYQVTVNYVSSNTNWGSVNRSKEVITLINKESGKWAETGTVTAPSCTATSAGGRCYFVNWTKKQEGSTASSTVTSSANLPEQLIENAKGGDVYTFTANFDRSSGGGSGGSNRPKPPVVEIPDDVPTGLNGKDHYAYIIGYGNNDVRPQNNITRAEVATIFFRLLTDETREVNMTKSNGYNDVKDGDWFCCAVSTLSKMGIIKGYEDGSFKPDQKITRAETMTLVNRVLNRLPETKDDLHKDMKTWVDNMDETAWYYLAVQEATNSHYFKNKTGTKFEQWTDLRDTRDWSELEK